MSGRAPDAPMEIPGVSPGDAPPPSAALLERVATMAAVRTRVPWRSLLVVAVLSLAWAGWSFTAFPVRRDLPWLSRTWVVALAVLWFAGYVLPLAAAILPRRGSVLPDGARAGRIAALSTLALIVIGLVCTRHAPGHSLVPRGAAQFLLDCVGVSLLVFAGAFTLALVVLRRVAQPGAWRVGAALGAAAGALGGLVLHFVCPFSTGAHVATAHGGAVALCAALGALVASRVLER